MAHVDSLAGPHHVLPITAMAGGARFHADRGALINSKWLEFFCGMKSGWNAGVAPIPVQKSSQRQVEQE